MFDRLRLGFIVLSPTAPPRDGVSVMIRNVTRGLYQRGHYLHMVVIRKEQDIGDISAYFPASSYAEFRIPNSPTGIWAAASRRLTAAIRGIPSWMLQDCSDRVENFLRDEFRRVPVDAIAIMANSLAPAAINLPDPAIWLRFSLTSEEAITNNSSLFSRWIARRFDRNIPLSYRLVAACTRSECEVQRRLSLRANVTYLPFGFEVPEFFEPPEDPTRDHELLFIADWNYPPNVDGIAPLLEKVMPRVWKKFPYVRLILAGKCPERLNGLATDKRVKVYGPYSTIGDIVDERTIAVLPLRRPHGIRTRVFELLQSCVPLVATSNAVPGLDIRDDEALVAEDWEIFSKYIVDCIESRELRRQLRLGGLRYLSREANIAQASEVWEEAFRSVIVSFDNSK